MMLPNFRSKKILVIRANCESHVNRLSAFTAMFKCRPINFHIIDDIGILDWTWRLTVLSPWTGKLLTLLVNPISAKEVDVESSNPIRATSCQPSRSFILRELQIGRGPPYKPVSAAITFAFSCRWELQSIIVNKIAASSHHLFSSSVTFNENKSCRFVD